MLCVDALCFRSMCAPGQTLAKLLPHLGRSACNSDTVPALRVVALPKVVSDKGLQRLDDATKESLLLSRHTWKGGVVVHSGDLPWILTAWLPAGTVGVPADAQSGSQDFFLRLRSGVVGFALKAASVSAGTDWSDVRDELSKAPKLPVGTPYTLVLWSLNLAAQLGASLGSAESIKFEEGKWYFRGGALLKEATSTEKPAFEVPLGQELIVANPLAPLGGRRHIQKRNNVMGELQSMSGPSGGLLIAPLTGWMAQAVVSPTHVEFPAPT